MKPKFSDVFWIVHEEMFKPKMNSYSWCNEIKNSDDIDYIRYMKVIPVYVRCISDMYDGTTEFSITPVDIRDGKTKNWRWSLSVEDKEIDVSVFTTEEKALNYFKERYTEEQIKVFNEKDEFRRISGAI